MERKLLIRIIIIIILVLIISILLISRIYSKSFIEEELIDDYIETTTTKELTTTTKKNKIKRIITTSKIKNNYVMVLEIPKIRIKKGIYDLNDKNNNVDKNITFLKSDYPNKELGTTILASHNGNTRVSYFKNLENLNKSDLAYIYYKGYKYIYEVYNIEIVDKIGTIKVKRNKSYNNLILISCKNGTNDKQIVYQLKLINKEAY